MLAGYVLFLMVTDVLSYDYRTARKIDHRFGRELIIADGVKSGVELIMTRMETLKREAAYEMEKHAEDMQAIMRSFEEVGGFHVCLQNRTEPIYQEICSCIEMKPAFSDYNNETFSLGQNTFKEWSKNYDSLPSDVNKMKEHIKVMQTEHKKSEKVCKDIVDPITKKECNWEIYKKANKTFEDIQNVRNDANKAMIEIKEALEGFIDVMFQHKDTQINDIIAKIESYVCCFDNIGLRVKNHECEQGNKKKVFQYNQTIAKNLEDMNIFLKHDYNSTRIMLNSQHKSEGDNITTQSTPHDIIPPTAVEGSLIEIEIEKTPLKLGARKFIRETNKTYTPQFNLSEVQVIRSNQEDLADEEVLGITVPMVSEGRTTTTVQSEEESTTSINIQNLGTESTKNQQNNTFIETITEKTISTTEATITHDLVKENIKNGTPSLLPQFEVSADITAINNTSNASVPANTVAQQSENKDTVTNTTSNLTKYIEEKKTNATNVRPVESERVDLNVTTIDSS